MRTFTPFVSDEQITAIGRGVIGCTLPKAAWTHAAHFAAAAWLIRCCEDLDAACAMPPMIRSYNEATGVANTDGGGYHETITQASLRATRAFLAARPALALFEAVNQLLHSSLGQPDWLLEYWSREKLFSVEARRRWVEPDRRPLPF